MSLISGLSRLDLAGLIAEALCLKGIDVVLTGGSCVSIYSNEQYVSVDLDFIDISLKTNRQIGVVLKSLGFENKPINSRYFAHPDTQLTVEFPSAPLMIGDEFIPESQTEKMQTNQGTLKLLSPTDCVKDRLANFYYFHDKQCLEQALMVASRHPINQSDLDKWHENENLKDEYVKFLTLIGTTNVKNKVTVR